MSTQQMAQQLDPRLIKSGRPDDNARGFKSATTIPEPITKATEYAKQDGSAGAASLAKGFGILKAITSYFEMAWEALERIASTTENLYWIGYSEGYARTLTLAAYGKDYSGLSFRPTSYGYARLPVYVHVDQLSAIQPRVPGREEASLIQNLQQRGRGFFRGKSDAIAALANANRGLLSETEYLNVIYRLVAIKSKVPSQLLIPLRAY